MQTAMDLATANSNQAAAKVLLVMSKDAVGAVAIAVPKQQKWGGQAAPKQKAASYAVAVKSGVDEIHDVLVDERHPHFLA